MDKSNAQKTFGTLKGKKILIVDDEHMNQLVIQNMIKLWGAESEIAIDGNDALQKIKEENYDIILMDLMMPGLDGYQTSQKIRTEFEAPVNKIPILALTGSSGSASINRIAKAGINDFAAKPFKIEELHSKVIKLIFKEQAGSTPKELADSEIINLAYLKETTNNNPRLIKDIINIFLKQTPGLLTRLEEASNSEDWAEVRTVAHKMKPTVSYVGINSIVNIVEYIENYCEQKTHLEEIPGLVKELKNKCRPAFIELKKELSKIQG